LQTIPHKLHKVCLLSFNTLLLNKVERIEISKKCPLFKTVILKILAGMAQAL